MKHAGESALNKLEELLVAVRGYPGLKEKKRGTFYRKSTGFLHFHEDPAGLFADLRSSSGWKRYPVNTPAERETLLAK